MGRLDRRPCARARWHFPRSLHRRDGTARSRRSDISRRDFLGALDHGRRVGAAERGRCRYRPNSKPAHSRHSHCSRHSRSLCDRLCGLRALRFPVAGLCIHPARPCGPGDIGGRASTWPGACGTRRGWRLRHAGPRQHGIGGLLGALFLSRRCHGGGFRFGPHAALAMACGHCDGDGRAVDVGRRRTRPHRGIDGTPVPRRCGFCACGRAYRVRAEIRPARRAGEN